MINRREALGSLAAALALWPRGSLALGAGEPSRTAQGAALHRAAHQLLERPLVFRDPLALKILGPERRRQLWAKLADRRGDSSRAMRAFIVTRSRYAEDELAAAFDGGIRQYIVLGAGLDTFAYRNPFGGALNVFEVDHPATQQWMRAQLQEQNIAVPARVTFVPVDFETDALGDCLDRAGFDRRAPAFISWLGVSMYLTKDAAYQTLRFVAQSCFRGSRIVFDFAPPDDMLGDAERARRNHLAGIVAKLGEPWLSWFDPKALADDLIGMGFTEATSIGASEANTKYFAGRTDAFRVSGSGRIMMARV